MKRIEKDNYIIKSEFSIMLYILYPVLAAACGFATYYFVRSAMFERGMNDAALYILGLCVLLMDVFAILHPMLACYDVYYDGEYLFYKWKFIPRNRKFRIQDIDGYYTMKVPSRNNEYMTAYPVQGNAVLPSISSFFYDNYEDVVRGLPVKHMGEIPFSWTVYFRLAFSRKRPD